MQLLKEQVLTRLQVQALPVKRRGRSPAGSTDGSTGTERLKALMKMKKAQAGGAARAEQEANRQVKAPTIAILPQNRKRGTDEI